MLCWSFSFDLLDHLFQAAVYGLGVCAEFGGSVFKPLVGGVFILNIEYLKSVNPFRQLLTFLVASSRGSFKVECCDSAS